MKKLLILLLLAIATHCFAQDWPVKKQVMAAKAKGMVFTNISAFSFVANKTLPQRGVYQQLKLNTSLLAELMTKRPDAIRVILPLSKNITITCDLVKFSMGNVKFTENNDGVVENIKIPVTYRGIVISEQKKNTVVLTVNEDYLSAVATMADKVIQVTKADEKDKSTYRLYNSTQLQFPVASPLECGTINTAAQTSNGIQLTGELANPLALRDKCINVFVDCFDSMYQWRNSNTQETVSYVYELFNAVATGFFNDSLNVQITAVNVWTTADHYQSTSSKNGLANLSANWKDNFFGNICVGLDYSIRGANRGGKAGGIGRIKAVTTNTCPAYDYSGVNTFSACCYNDLNQGGDARNYPTGPSTTGPQIDLVMHEMGHLLGAHHTHWCGWKLSSNPDTFGAIDNCAPTEAVNNSTPACPPGPAPTNGGTIMSYCSIAGPGQFSYFYNGFGKLPGDAIRNFIDQSACILLCVDCFGSINKGNNNNNYAYNKNTNLDIKYENEEEIGHAPIQKKQPNENVLIINSQKIKQ